MVWSYTIWDEVVANPINTSKYTIWNGNSVFDLRDVLQECIPSVKRDLPVFAIDWWPMSFIAKCHVTPVPVCSKKLRKVTASSCLSVHMEQLGCHGTDVYETGIWLFFEVWRVLYKETKTCVHLYLAEFLEWEIFQTKIVEKITFYVQ